MDKKSMGLVREFDVRLLEAREYDAWMYQVPFWFMEGGALLLGILSWNDKDYGMGLICMTMFALAIDFELSGYIKFQGQSVYELLAYYPVKKRDIYLVRLGYLKNKLIKRLGVLYFVQGLFLWHQGIITLERIVFPLYFVAFAAVTCGIDMIPFRKVRLRGK